MSRQTRLDWFSLRAEARRFNRQPSLRGRRPRPLRFEPLEDRRVLAIVVDTLVDESDGIGVGGISLRDAIAAAAPNEFINFAPELTAAGPATISLTHGELVINKPLSISGPGASLLTIDASAGDPTPNQINGDGHRVFRIDNGNSTLAVVSISLVTISGGDTGGDGGGIENHENLSVSDSVISGNAADDGGALYNTTGYATLTRVTLRDNVALDDGGAITNSFGRVTIQDSSLIANTAGDDGGGVFSASDIGGFHNLTIRNSTLTGNTAAGWGGAVFNFSGIASIEFSTIARNTSTSGVAGGVGSWGDTNLTRTDVRSSIIAGNAGSDVDHPTGAPGPVNSFNSLKYNLIGLGTSLGKFNQAGDQTGVADPRLGPLGDYGGPTQTLPLLFNSPAIDAGDPTAVSNFLGVPLNDQRGYFRIVDGNGDNAFRIDIGAFETDVRYIQVDNLVDENDGVYSAGDLSMREAVQLSNLFESADWIFFRPDLSGQTITLHEGELTINDSTTVDASALAAGITIDASGNDLTPGVEDGKGSRLLVLQDDGSYFNQITLRKLTLTGADGNGSGGAIFNNDITSVEDCTITGNSSQWGAGIYNTPYGSLVVARSTISGNSAISPIPEAIGSGGGLYNWGGNLQVLDSVVTGNDSVSDAGGIQNVNGGYLTVARSTVSGNSAVNFGGGIRNGDGYVRIESSTISGNSAQKGGGIHVVTPNFRYTTIFNSTLSGNVAPLGGGGLFNESGKVRFQFSTVTENVSNDFAGSGVVAALSPGDSPVAFYHTIVADNFNPDGPRPSGAIDVAVYGPTNSLVSQGYNLIGTGSFVEETFVESGDQIIGIADPGLGPLADNGGETKTHALLVGSPAIDAGSPSVFAGGEGGGPVYDQRGPGFDRIRDGNADEVIVIDIGAFELQQFNTAPALPGDYNHDDIVDAADYTVWRDALNRSVAAYSGADGDGDGTVDQDDYDVWRAHFGQSLPGSAAQVQALLAAGGGSIDGSILVTTLDDTTDFSDGLTSLREAIFAANIVSGPNVIEFAESLTAAGPATILLTQGELAITDAVSIVGPGEFWLAIDASGNDPDLETHGDGSRIFNIDDGNASVAIEVSISGLSLTGGDVNQPGGAILSREKLLANELAIDFNWAVSGGAIALLAAGGESVVSNSILMSNRAASQGGALYLVINTGGAIVLRDNFVVSNEAQQGGAISVGAGTPSGLISITRNTILTNAAEQGGAVFFTPQSPATTIRDTEVSGNTSARQGGGIFASAGRNLSIVNSQILENRSLSENPTQGRGGGIYSNVTDLAITGSTISGNRAANGGGIDSRGGDLSVQFSALRDNTAFNGNGGGLYSSRDRLTLLGSTITGNQALGLGTTAGRGGGVWHAPTFTSTSTIADNVLTGNSAQGYGGGLYFRPTQETAASVVLSIDNLTITGNSAARGGGVAAGLATRGASVGTLIVNGGAIADNTASSHGGGIYAQVNNLIVNDTAITENSAAGNGGGVAGPTEGQQSIQMTFDGAVISGNRASSTGDGGGVWVSAGSAASAMTFRDTQILGNTAARGAGLFRLSTSSQGTLSIASSWIGNNIASNAGGGVYNQGGFVTVSNSRLEANEAHSSSLSGSGGGILNRQADLIITTSTISGNVATQSQGGGVYHNGGDLTVVGTTISGNRALAAGGGIWASTSIGSDRISFHSSTISGNSSTNSVAGMWLQGDVTIRHSTISFNRTTNQFGFAAGLQMQNSQLELDHVIVAKNFVGENTERDLTVPSLTKATVRSSLIGSNATTTTLVPAPVGSPDANGNLIGAVNEIGGGLIDPLLSPLFNHGGPTQTHALLPLSPAIDAGALASLPLGYDQRGNPYSRMVDGDGDGQIHIDIGAFESQGIPQFTSGDFNRDGVVDSCDYLIWRDTLGATVEPFQGADADGDGLIGESDFNIWHAHFGQGLTYTTATGSGALAATALAIEPQASVTPLSALQPPAPQGEIRTPTPRRTFLPSRLTTSSTDQVLAWWSAKLRIAATHAATPADSASHGECEDPQDDVATLDLAFAALAG